MRPRPLLPYTRESFRSFAQTAQDQSTPNIHELAHDDPYASHRRLSNQSVVGVYSCDASGVITYYNSQAVILWGRMPILGDTDERFCGSHMLYRVDGSFMPYDQSPMAAVLAGKVWGVSDAEVHIERPDKSRVTVIANIAPLIDDKGVIVGAISSFYEASQLKPANDLHATR